MVADRREFIRLDIGYFDNPKIADAIEASPFAALAHLASMAHARQHRTDGVVVVKRILRKVGATEADAKILFDLGLWHDVGEGKAELHDYLEHQESSAQIKKLSEAGKKGAAGRWKDKGTADRTANGNANRYAEESREEERREEAPLVSPTRDEPRDAHYEDDHAQMETVSPETVLPRSFSLDTRHKAYAMTKGLDVGEELGAFKDHARANGRTAVDWSAAFSGWLRASAKRKTEQNSEPPRPGSSVWKNDTTGQGARP